MKPEMWAKVAEDLQVPWRAAEAMHWALGEAEMARRAGVVAFSMTPAAYGEPSSNAVSSPSSGSGMDSSTYGDALPVQDELGRRTLGGLKQSGAAGEESEGGVVLGPAGHGPSSNPSSKPTQEGRLEKLPSLAGFGSGVCDRSRVGHNGDDDGCTSTCELVVQNGSRGQFGCSGMALRIV